MNMRECLKELNSCMVEANQMIMEEKGFINCARTGAGAPELDVLAGYLETASDSVLALAEATSLIVIKPDPKKNNASEFLLQLLHRAVQKSQGMLEEQT